MRISAVMLIAGILLGATGTWFVLGGTGERDASTPEPESASLPDLPEPYYRVLFENDAVRIVDHRLEPGASEPEHTHPPMVVYFVSGATVEITEADGSTSEASIPTGTFLGEESLRWWTHSLENTGETPLHSILVEFKHDLPAR